jgi:para-aminobenzoate synthetase/4-amino-4-deoxychorismate lyase
VGKLIHTTPSQAGEVRLWRQPLDVQCTPEQALRAFGDEPWRFALTGRWAGGGAIVGAGPLIPPGPVADPFARLDELPEVRGAAPETAVGGGWFGWLGYRLSARVERVPLHPRRPAPLPDHQLAYYDHVLRCDPTGHWWFEALMSPAREKLLRRRAAELARRLARSAPPPVHAAPDPFSFSAAARARHAAAIAQCRERIAAGEIFQANICTRLDSRWDGEVTDLYAHAAPRLRPAYGGVFAAPWGGIASLSPELFLRRRGAHVLTAPIKGTIRRAGDRAQELVALATLRSSEKDAAEHVMIVDLMRNDLGRVCRFGTVRAPRRPEAEPHPGLWHLVSGVTGELRADTGHGELLRATFPPGSVTGAPKVQSLHVIAELETAGREAYTGAVGFASPCAGLELNVAIRTLELCDGRLGLGVGGGIVADSEPAREVEEVLVKAAPIVAALGSRIELSGTESGEMCAARVAATS